MASSLTMRAIPSHLYLPLTGLWYLLTVCQVLASSCASANEMAPRANQSKSLITGKGWTGGINKLLLIKKPIRKWSIKKPWIWQKIPNFLWQFQTPHWAIGRSFPLKSYLKKKSCLFIPNLDCTQSPKNIAGVFDKRTSWKMWSHQHSLKWGRICCHDSSINSSIIDHMWRSSGSLMTKLAKNQSPRCTA